MFEKLKKALTLNPLGAFIWAIIAKWYIMILIPSVIVLYWVLKGLTASGVFVKAESVFSKSMNDVKAVAKYCTPLITNLDQYWKCLQKDFKYEETDESAKMLEQFGKDFEEKFNTDINTQINNSSKPVIEEDPYEK